MSAWYSRVCAILVVALCVWGPGTPGNLALATVCDLCVCAIDATCSSPEISCSNQSGCVPTEFTVPCTGNYTFHLKLRCNSVTFCENCLACGYIYTASGSWVDGLQTGCGTSCSGSSHSVTLTAGVTYKLYACLRTCSESCNPCSDCSALARVYQTIDDCSAPCQ